MGGAAERRTPPFPRVRVRGLTPQRCSIPTLVTSNRSLRSRPELQADAEIGPAPSVAAAGANYTFQGQRGNALRGVEFAVRDPAVPGKVRVGFLKRSQLRGLLQQEDGYQAPKRAQLRRDS